ncbi:Putative 54S ribosomal protein L15 [Septoria linicola]|uniref:54S ribosomal protein L15 n=1 Tax=Septoria linicola TaxID=215465 RepID=A0A9Q9EH30_9PEZI|nr:putative 54S ribosomal protein L15 [Septoria linicola]USW51391.1 Putative 54S ribosomal protein L15 [Septoria linicola]
MNPSRPAFVCSSCARALRHATKPQTARQFSVTAPGKINDSVPEDKSELPRWMKTPERLRQPIHLRPRIEQSISWRVNSDPEKLNAAYDSFLGRVGGNQLRGRELLDEQTKWLATTHKSHEHGAQGFNDRLAYLGKRILDLQTSLALLSAPSPTSSPPGPASEVFQHTALENLENISQFNKASTLHKSRLSALASQYGLDRVVRWKPRNAENLKQSGIDAVMAQTIYAIIGALAMQRGGEVAAKTARERVLAPLGLR